MISVIIGWRIVRSDVIFILRPINFMSNQTQSNFLFEGTKRDKKIDTGIKIILS